jgi:hypothetical protein
MGFQSTPSLEKAAFLPFISTTFHCMSSDVHAQHQVYGSSAKEHPVFFCM